MLCTYVLCKGAHKLTLPFPLQKALTMYLETLLYIKAKLKYYNKMNLLKMKKRVIHIFFILSLAFIYGCSTGTQAGVEVEKISLEKEEIQKTTKTLTQFAGTTSPYYRFDKAHFENSLQQGKIIFLDFHADWCPICQKEKPEILAAFNELNNENVVGYQVHYNDKQTTEDDKEMAKKYGITYQHTKVIIGKDGKVALKSLEVFSKEKVINEINKAIMG